jgi:hypothetical protein
LPVLSWGANSAIMRFQTNFHDSLAVWTTLPCGTTADAISSKLKPLSSFSPWSLVDCCRCKLRLRGVLLRVGENAAAVSSWNPDHSISKHSDRHDDNLLPVIMVCALCEGSSLESNHFVTATINKINIVMTPSAMTRKTKDSVRTRSKFTRGDSLNNALV